MYLKQTFLIIAGAMAMTAAAQASIDTQRQYLSPDTVNWTSTAQVVEMPASGHQASVRLPAGNCRDSVPISMALRFYSERLLRKVLLTKRKI